MIALSRLMLTVFVREIEEADENKNPNGILLSGYICKPPVYRTTPFNREIADVLIAVNRAYNKSDYIPCIAWGRNARFVKNLSVGDKVAISGRIQSREYQKKLSETETKTMTAYEVSVSKLAAFDNAEDVDIETEFDLVGELGAPVPTEHIMRLADMGIACHGGSHAPQGSFGVLFLYVLYGGVYLHFKKIIRLVCFFRDVKNVFTVHILRSAQQLAVEEDICYGVYPVEFQQQCLGGKHFFRQRETALINAVLTSNCAEFSASGSGAA